jgi:uncharacterized protein (DUF433 family)
MASGRPFRTVGRTEAPQYFPEITAEAAMNWREHIWIDAERMHGIPCMRGTRIPVYIILDNLADGESVEAIIENYPSLRPEHMSAALAFAAELAHEKIVQIPA